MTLSRFGLHGVSGEHDMPSLSKDIAAVVKELVQRSSVFYHKEGRRHRSFKSVKGSIITKVNKEQLTKWMNIKLKKALAL